jgi:hypothetical protein
VDAQFNVRYVVVSAVEKRQVTISNFSKVEIKVKKGERRLR